MERVIIDEEGYCSFNLALKVDFALYFVFNLQYPKKFSKVLETIQRYFFKIHPDAGSNQENKLNQKVPFLL